MKKILISLLLFSCALPTFAQQLKPVKIDSLVTISMPSNFSKKDTAGQEIYSGTTLLGYEVVIREDNAKNNKALKQEKDLKKVFKKYVSDIQAQSPGSVTMNVRDTLVGALEGKAFTLEEMDDNTVSGLRDFLLIYTKDATYTFEYVYPQNRVDVVKSEIKSFFSSIKLSKQLQRDDQYLFKGSSMNPAVKYGLIGGAALIIIIVIMLIIRRRKTAEADLD